MPLALPYRLPSPASRAHAQPGSRVSYSYEFCLPHASCVLNAKLGSNEEQGKDEQKIGKFQGDA